VSTEAWQVQELGRPIKGPSALAGDASRFLYLTRTLAVTEFKLKFFGSVLGYLWQLMRPLLLFGVLYVVFTKFVKFGSGSHYAVVLLAAIVLFSFFSEATGGAVSSVIDRENLVRKIHFPRLVIPLSVVLLAYLNLALNLVVVFIFAIASGVEIRLGWLELPVLLLLLGIFATGVATLLSALYVRFRDIRPIWDVALQIMFYASPVLYPIERVQETHTRVAKAMMVNPFAATIEQVRHALIDPTAPTPAAVMGGWYWVLIPIGIAIGAFALGLWVFNREAPRIAEEL